MAKVNTENLSLIYFLLICHRMVRNKCPPLKKTLWPENYDKGIVVLLFWSGDICGKCICKLPRLEILN